MVSVLLASGHIYNMLPNIFIENRADKESGAAGQGPGSPRGGLLGAERGEGNAGVGEKHRRRPERCSTAEDI